MHTTDDKQPVGESWLTGTPGGDTWPDAAAPGAAQWHEDAANPGAPDRTGRRRLRVLALAGVAAVGIAAGAAAEVAITSGSDAPSIYSAGPAPGPGGGNGGLGSGAYAGPGPGAGRSGHVLLAGPVTAVTATSITIGRGSTYTFAVTPATRFPGRAKAISSVKVGDRVAISGTLNGHAGTAVAVTDPPNLSAP